MKKKSDGKSNGSGGASPSDSDKNSDLPIGPTGRFLVVLNPNTHRTLLRSLSETMGFKVASSSDFDGAAVNEAELGDADALLFEHLNIAVVEADDDQLRSLETAIADESNPVLAVEPEEYVVPLVDHSRPVGVETESRILTDTGLQYISGYRDAVAALTERLLSGSSGGSEGEFGANAVFVDTPALTWGLQATRANFSPYTGAGIRVAVLDTGFDLRHPDFVGRSLVSASFVPGQGVQDAHSHGTHCIGTACGPKTPPGNSRRYGIAWQSVILAGKVLNNAGSGRDGWILAGINWAIQNRAAVISMSLGSPVAVGGTFKQAYEQAAQAALSNGCIIVAAAGNAADTPVNSPANCPSIIAVAALTNTLQRAPFSCLGINGNGGEVNIAAPGVNTYSSVPMPARYGLKSGTSMATPHVAGLAALRAQSTGLRGTALWRNITGTAVNLGLPVRAVGAGLAVAPAVNFLERAGDPDQREEFTGPATNRQQISIETLMPQ